MKKIGLVFLVLIGIVVAVVTSDALAQQKVIKLTYSDHSPPTAFSTLNATEYYLKEIERVSDGRIKIERYYVESLAKGTDAWMAVKTGVADMAFCSQGYWPGLTPLSDVVTLPFLPLKSGAQASGVLWKLRDKYPQIQKEWSDVQLLVIHCTPPFTLLTTKKQVKTMEDLKGLKLRVLAGPPTDAFKTLGAVPVLLGMPDCYMAMQKGTIDGLAIPLGIIEIFKFHEVTKYWTHVPVTTAYLSIIMNKAKFNGLPPDLQKAVMSVSGYEGSRTFAHRYHDSYEAPVRKVLDEHYKKTGHKLEEYTLPKAEFDRWVQAAGKPVWDRWTAGLEAKGLPAKAVVADTLQLIETEPK
jgi:TRAP-type C4-dicarboxylate transport system substrate-binding protein